MEAEDANPFDVALELLESLGFRLEEIAPADDPAEALLTGHGVRLRLDRAHRGATELVVPAGGTPAPGRHLGPSGLVVEGSAARELDVPPAAPAFVHTRFAETPFHEGRAGLLYRDLLPSRLGGRWIASHIRAARGGPVNDRVHHHRVRLQLIYCLSGEAELVYQDQGPPFAFRAGDLVLQPPGLRHRVLAASAGFEVVELASPAWHPTSIDHDMVLPSPDRLPDRRRSGQRFLHAVADRCSPQLLAPGVEARDLGLHAASGGLATARALQFEDAGSVELREADDLRFLFVSAGTGSIDREARTALAPGDALALPPGQFVLTGSPGLRVLEVTSTAGAPATLDGLVASASAPEGTVSDRKAQGVEATNQAFRQYDQVEKRQEYHLAEAHHGEAFDEETRIPTCDLGRFLRGDEGDRQAFASELGEGLRRLGFAILEGHGVDSALYDEADERILEMFTELPLEEKMRYRARRLGSVNQGYFPIKETSDIHPDLVEGWVFCRRAFDLDGDPSYRETDYWPRPHLEPLFRRVCQAHERLTLPVMQSLLRSLGCDPHLYDRALTRTNFGLRLNHYPPLSAADEASGGGRMLGHEDVDLFTFLPASRVEGLQVLNRANGKWIRLAAPRGSLILNTGDYAQRISNDIFPSTTHRVSPPRQAGERQRPRVSLPMAIYLWEDEVLEVLPGLEPRKYEPIKAINFHTRITSKYYGDDYAVG